MAISKKSSKKVVKKSKAKAAPEKEVKAKKKVAGKTAKAGKVSKEAKAMSPLEKARANKAAGKKSSKAKKKKMIFKAPEGFKPFFLEIMFKTEKDGLIGGMAKGTRFKGAYDPKADDKKKFDLSLYDQNTLRGVMTRLAARTFVVNETKRLLKPSTVYRVLIRAGRRTADNSLTAGIKGVWERAENGKGREVFKELDKKNPTCRKVRSAGRFLPAAFVNTQEPPKPVRGKKNKADDE